MTTLLELRSQTARRSLAAGSLLMALLGALLLVAVGPARADSTPTGQQFLDRINASRQAAGLRPLAMHPGLVDVGRTWSAQLAQNGALSHNPRLVDIVNSQVDSRWSRLGENVGYGPDVDNLHTAFMNSQHHRDNILGDYNTVGIGLVVQNGRIWVTEDFMKSPAAVRPQAVPAGRNPVGNVDAIVPGHGAVRVAGWALDPDTTDSTDVHIYLDGAFAGRARADGARPDVDRAFGDGSAHGFDVTVPAGQGGHVVCTYAINLLGGTTNPQLHCASTVVADNPRGNVEQSTRSLTGVHVSGWALDPDTTSPVRVHIYVDGRFATALDANGSRGDVAAAFAMGDRHGFDTSVVTTPGAHTVCVYAINIAAGDTNPELSCRTV